MKMKSLLYKSIVENKIKPISYHYDEPRWAQYEVESQRQQSQVAVKPSDKYIADRILGIRDIEQLLQLPPSEFYGICELLGLKQSNTEYIGEFYLRVYDAIMTVLIEMQVEKSKKQYAKAIEESRGNYTRYQAYVDNCNERNIPIEEKPYTDYEAEIGLERLLEIEYFVPSRTYEDWLKLATEKAKLDRAFYGEFYKDDDEMPF